MNTQTEKTDKVDADASNRYNGGMKRRGNHTGTLSRKAEGKNWTARWYRTGHLSERYKRLFEACGIQTSGEDEDGKMRVYTGSHSIRHTAATNLLEAGATMKEVAEILGHKSIKTTEKYLHVNVDNLRRVVEKLKSVA